MKEVTETVVKGDDESPHLKDPQPSVETPAFSKQSF